MESYRASPLVRPLLFCHIVSRPIPPSVERSPVCRTEKVSRVADIMTAKTVISVEPTTTGSASSGLLKHVSELRQSHVPPHPLSSLSARQLVEPSTSTPPVAVLEALKLLKEHRITGMPVLDPSRGNRVCGVVSDFDLIALDAVSGTRDVSLFPEPGEDWVVFKNLQRLVTKTTATTVGEVMTDEPFVVTPDCSVEKAARLLLEKRLRRLPVVESEESMQLVGIVSRADIVDAAIKTMGL